MSPTYLTPQDESKQIKQFFNCLGVWEKCEFQFSYSIQIQAALQVPHSFMDAYLEALFSDENPAKPAKRGHKEIDTISPFLWFPFIQFIPYSPRLEGEFWKEIEKQSSQILSRYNKETYHADHVTNGRKMQPFTYLQYLFANQSFVRSSTLQFMRAAALFAPSMYPIVGNIQPTAQIPVKLSPEMEKFLGFKSTLDVQACQTFLQVLKRSYKHDLYIYVMDQLLQILRKADPITLEGIKKWEFLAANNEWKAASQLKAWAIAHAQVPDTAEWLKDIFKAKETEEFCTLLKIQIIKEDVKVNPFEQAQKCPALTQFLFERAPVIAFFWNRSRNNEKDAQNAVELILTQLKGLECYVKADEEGLNKPVLKDQKLLVYDDWETNKERIGKCLYSYFGLKTKAEKIAIIKSICREWSFRENSNEGRTYQPYKEAFLKLSEGAAFSTSPATLAQVTLSKEEDLTISHPSPPALSFTPEKKKENIPLPPDAVLKSPSKQELETVWHPQTPAQRVTTTPSKPLTPRPDWQPAVRATLIGAPKPKRETTEQSERRGLSDLDKKRIGLWAEEHVLTKLVDKFKSKIPEANVLINKGTRIIQDKTGTRSYQIVWNNDPALRPGEKRDDELWDSGKQCDIELVYEENGKPVRRRFYEVKGTTGPTVHFFLSRLEWQTYLSNPGEYRLRVVTEAGTEQAQVTRIKDLLESLKQKSLLPISNTEFKG